MLTTPALMTADDVLRMPNPKDLRLELVRGELMTMAPAGFDHGAKGGLLHGRLWSYVTLHRLGIVPTSDTGYILSRDPDTMRCPDTSFVSAARIPKEPVMGFFPGSPDLVVEVLSPTDSLDEMQDKVADYLFAGTKLVWVVSPGRKSVTVYRPGQKPEWLGVGETLSGEDVVPGFSLPVADIFA